MLHDSGINLPFIVEIDGSKSGLWFYKIINNEKKPPVSG